MQKTSTQIVKVAEFIKKANKILITAGAGMGVDSGMPDFRGPEGFWNIFKPFSMRFTFEECANPSFLHSHPKYFWGFYGYRLDLYRKTEPHSGFKALLELCNKGNIADSFVVTSNVDGHFQKAGFDQSKVYEIHGSIHHMQCNSCSTIFPAKEYLVPYNSETFEANDPLPSCKTCKSVIRPNIMMFGDYEFDNTRCQKQNQVYREFVNRLEKKDLLVVLEFGAGHGVPTIRNLGEQMLASNKCETKLVRINLRDYDPPMYYSKKKEKDFIAIADSALNFTKELEKELN